MERKIISVEHYPFRVGEERDLVRCQIKNQIAQALNLSPIENGQKNGVFDCIETYFKFAEAMFVYEEEGRKRGELWANLFYHLVDHAVYQATYDGAAIVSAILKREDAMSSYLTKEGVVATILGAMYHDVGYVRFPDSPNYAALTPLHVDKSMQEVDKTIRWLGLPRGFDEKRVIDLARLGIHNTYFPYTNEHKAQMREMVEAMDLRERKEAYIVRLAVQLADLGGQVARVDYFPRLVQDLRAEINCATPGLGTVIMGEDHELTIKCAGFINFITAFTKGRNTVAQTANAFFGSRENDLARSWRAICCTQLV